jgi:hypothetical protein
VPLYYLPAARAGGGVQRLAYEQDTAGDGITAAEQNAAVRFVRDQRPRLARRNAAAEASVRVFAHTNFR